VAHKAASVPYLSLIQSGTSESFGGATASDLVTKAMMYTFIVKHCRQHLTSGAT
jgi:hypothetical protein